MRVSGGMLTVWDGPVAEDLTQPMKVTCEVVKREVPFRMQEGEDRLHDVRS